jgi:hypothetical protein
MPSWKMGDLPMWLFLAQYGAIYRMPDYTGVYRILETSASHYKSFIEQYDFLLEGFRIRLWFNNKYKLSYKRVIYTKLISRTRKICRKWAKNGEGKYSHLLVRALRHLWKSGLKR